MPTSSIVRSFPAFAGEDEVAMPPSQPVSRTAKTTFWTSRVHKLLYLYPISEISISNLMAKRDVLVIWTLTRELIELGNCLDFLLDAALSGRNHRLNYKQTISYERIWG